MSLKRFSSFALKVTAAHTVSYFITGALAYQFLTRQFYEGPAPIFATFMRTPAEPELWRAAMIWFLPGQMLRGLLIAAALFPFFETLKGWNFPKRMLSISGLYLALGFWATAVAAPGTRDDLSAPRDHALCPFDKKTKNHCAGAGDERLAGKVDSSPSASR